MAVHAGSEGTIKIGSSTLGEIKSFSINETADTIEKTKMGDSARSFIVGLQSFDGSASSILMKQMQVKMLVMLDQQSH